MKAKLAKFLVIGRIAVTHAYVILALYLFAVLVKNTVDFHQFEFEAAKAFYSLFSQLAPRTM